MELGLVGTNRSDKFVVACTTATCALTLFGASSYFQWVRRTGNWWFPRKPTISKKDLITTLKDLEPTIVSASDDAITAGKQLKNGRQGRADVLKQIHEQLDKRIEQATKDICARRHLKQRNLEDALKYYENDETVKSLNHKFISNRPTVLFPAKFLNYLYATYVKEIGIQLEKLAARLQKDGFTPSTSAYQRKVLDELDNVEEIAINEVLKRHDLERSRLFFDLNCGALAQTDRQFQSLSQRELQFKIATLSKIGCEAIAQQMYMQLQRQQQQRAQAAQAGGMGGLGGMM